MNRFNAVVAGDKAKLAINTDKFSFLRKHFPDAQLRIDPTGDGVLQFTKSNNVEAVLIPIIQDEAQLPDLFERSEGSLTETPFKKIVAINLPDTCSQELFTNLEVSKPEEISSILNISPSNFTNLDFIQSHISKTRKLSQRQTYLS